MTLENEVKLSFYKELSVLREFPRISVVQHIDTGRIYIQKTLFLHNLNPLQQLQSRHISGIPDVYEIIDCSSDSNQLSTEETEAIDKALGALSDKVQFKKVIVVEEYISGEILSEMLYSEHSISITKSVDIMLQLLNILAEIQKLTPPIIHRDIKPENIILNSDGKVFLLDFDISRNYKTGSRNDTLPLGTSDYAAPEQYGFLQSDVRTDIYACGVLFNKMLTGRLPKDELHQGIGAEIIERCLKFNPDDRYQNVDEVINDIFTLR